MESAGPSGRARVAAVTQEAPSPGPSGSGQGEAAWRLLAAARAEFEQAPWTADFVQTYVPAGFSSGDRETGRVSIALPDSLRWDYEVPYPKAFLIVGSTAHSWNDGEAAGRRAELAPEDRRHLDLMRLDLDSLRESFTAQIDEEGRAIELAPLDETSPIRTATLEIDPATSHLVALAWSDLEGNRTEFLLSGHRIVADPDLFEPPAGLDWFTE